jgi:hypothetical protein
MHQEEIEFFAESDPDKRKRLWVKASFVIAILGWIIIGSTLNSIIFSAFPIKIASPEWQLSLIGTLLSTSVILLVGTSFVVLSLLFNSRDATLQQWQRVACRLAAWLSVLLVLVIPLQFFLGSKALSNQTIGIYEAINNLKGIEKGLNAINSEPELRAYVASLPNPPELPAKFDAPFAVIKQRAIDNIQSQINAGTNNIEIQKSQGLQLFLKESIRNTAQAILMAAAFSAIANLSSKTKNLVTRFFDARLNRLAS